MLRYLLIFIGVVLLAVMASAFYAGLGLYLAEEYTPTQIHLQPPR